MKSSSLVGGLRFLTGRVDVTVSDDAALAVGSSIGTGSSGKTFETLAEVTSGINWKVLSSSGVMLVFGFVCCLPLILSTCLLTVLPFSRTTLYESGPVAFWIVPGIHFCFYVVKSST